MVPFEQELRISLQQQPDFPLAESQLDVALEGIAFIRGRLDGRLPSVDDIRLFRPERTMFQREEDATDPKNPHNEAHYSRGAMGLVNLTRLRLSGDPGLALDERVLLTAFRWHDAYQGRWENNPLHGPQAADAFWNDKGEAQRFTFEQRQAIQWLLYYHSELHDPPHSVMRDRYLEALNSIRDTDASELMRKNLFSPVPAEAIILRTPEARACHLPYVMKLVENVAELSNTGDSFEDQLVAAQRLGLLVPSYFQAKATIYLS